MTIKIKDAAGVLQTITGGKIRDGATLRQLQTIKLWDGTTMRTVAQFVPPLTASASPAFALVFGTTSTLTTSSVTAVPSGGLAPYTYVWTRTSGAATANTPAIASTTFTQTGLIAEDYQVSTFNCVVSDSSGQTANFSITAEFNRISGF
jgi:hypothetical protein